MRFPIESYKTIVKSLNRVIKTPLYIILFVSNQCWLKCKHCWFNEKWKNEHLTQNKLTFEEYKLLSKSLKKVSFMSFTGGEAFLRDDIVEIITMFLQNARISRYQIPTSGYDPELIIKKTSKILNRNRDIPLRIDVSIDGFPDTHDYIRNTKGSFNNAIKTVHELNLLKKKYKNLSVGIMTTLSHYNQYEIDPLVNYLSKKISGCLWNLIVVRGKSRKLEAKDIDIDCYYQANEIINQYLKTNQDNIVKNSKYSKWIIAKNSLRGETICDVLSKKYKFQGCTAGTLSCVIYSDGSVYPCELLNHPLGHLKEFDYNLQLLLRSIKSDQIRQYIQDRQCVCTQECFFPMNILIQPKQLVKLVRKYLELIKM